MTTELGITDLRNSNIIKILGVSKYAQIHVEMWARRALDQATATINGLPTQMYVFLLSFSSGSMLGRSDPVLCNSYSLPAMPSFSMSGSLPMQVRLYDNTAQYKSSHLYSSTGTARVRDDNFMCVSIWLLVKLHVCLYVWCENVCHGWTLLNINP